MKSYSSIDEYIGTFPDNIQKGLNSIRKTIQAAAPAATEKITYGIPTFYYKGNLVHFAAYDSHYGFYPGAQAIADFAKDLRGYQTSKGTIRFEIEKPLPLDLIKRITLYRVKSQNSK